MDDKNNSGDENSGSNNSGDWNSGSNNSNNWNSGWHNSGPRNSGWANSGCGNSGDWNSGFSNSGMRNSGWVNSGKRNSGYGNSTNGSAGIFCSIEPQITCFDKPTGKKWDEISHPHFNEFFLTKWVPEWEMNLLEKIDNPAFRVTKGYLKKIDYKEAWANFWRDTDEWNRQRFLELPNFDPVIFKEITGIDVNAQHSCSGKIVEIDGVKYELRKI